MVPYSAVMVWRPGESAEVVQEPCPEALKREAQLGIVTPSAAKLTTPKMPPGTKPAGDVTVAVKVTLCPTAEGLAEEETATDVDACAISKARETAAAPS